MLRPIARRVLIGSRGVDLGLKASGDGRAHHGDDDGRRDFDGRSSSILPCLEWPKEVCALAFERFMPTAEHVFF